jgi:hypothetical protein
MRGASFSESVAKAAGEFVRPFVSEEIFWKSVREAWSNKKDSGTTSGPVYNEEDTANEKAKAIIGHVLSAVEPGAISSGRRILKGFRGEVSEGGKAYDPKVEMAAVATGLRIQDIDIEQAASYRLREFARARERIEDILRKPLGRKGAVAPAEIVEARDRMEMLRKAEFAEVQETIQAARRLGVPLSKVVTIARAAGVKADELKLLVSGQYRPYQVSREMLKRSLQANPQEFPTRYKALLSPPAAPPDPGAATVPLGM